MIKDLKDALKLAMMMKNAKSSVVIGIVSAAFGVLTLFLNVQEGFCGGLFTMYAWMMPIAFVAQQEVCTMCAASPKRRRISINSVDLLTVCGAVTSYLCIALAANLSPRNVDKCALVNYVVVSAILIFYGIAYRAYWMGVILLGVVVGVGCGCGSELAALGAGLTDWQEALVGLGLVAIGWFGGSLLRHLLYKRPVSSVMNASLERQLAK